MSLKRSSSSRSLANPHILVPRLVKQCEPHLSDLTVGELDALAWPTVERVFAALLLTHEPLQQLVQARAEQAAAERRQSTPKRLRTQTLQRYKSAFCSAVLKAAQARGFKAPRKTTPASASSPLPLPKKLLLALVSFFTRARPRRTLSLASPAQAKLARAKSKPKPKPQPQPAPLAETLPGVEEDAPAHVHELHRLLLQLTSERAAENHDERRLALLKAQNLQLERQVFLLKEALEQRRAAMVGIAEDVAALAASTALAEPLRRQAAQVHKAVQAARSQRLMLGWQYVRDAEQHSLLDLYSNDKEHLNFDAVVALESALHDLRGDLLGLHADLVDDQPDLSAQRIAKLASKCREACFDLGHLSVVTPSPYRHARFSSSTTCGFEREPVALEATVKQFKQVLADGKLSTKVAQRLATRMERDYATFRDDHAMHRAEVRHLRERDTARTRVFEEALAKLDTALQRFNRDSNETFREIADSLGHVVATWGRNPKQTNLERLLSQLQVLLPSIRQLMVVDDVEPPTSFVDRLHEAMAEAQLDVVP